MSQAIAAQLVGRSERWLRDVESGAVGLWVSDAGRLAEVLRVDVADLVRETGEMAVVDRRSSPVQENPARYRDPVALAGQVELQLEIDNFTGAVDLGVLALQRSLPPDIEAKVRFVVGRAYTRMAKGEAALGHLRRARQLFEEAGDLRMTVKSIAQEASALSSLDDTRSAARALEALQLCERIRPPRPGLRSHILILLGTIHNRRHDWHSAAQFFQQGLGLQLDEPDPRQAAVARDGLSWAYQQLGRWEEACEHAEAAYAFGCISPDPRDRAKAAHNRGYLHYRFGDLAEAERYFTYAISVCVEHGLRRDQADITLGLAQIQLLRRELDAALASARDVLALAELGRVFRSDAGAWQLMGMAFSERGDHEAARRAFGAALGGFIALELPHDAEACRKLYEQALEARGTIAS